MIERSLYPTQKIYDIDKPQAVLMSYGSLEKGRGTEVQGFFIRESQQIT